ncbi:hypothetical protein Tco_0714367 [Tanacetum coccineum]
MQETYKNGEATPIPTPIFSVHNWALKNNQPGGPPFTAHMLDICKANGPTKEISSNTNEQPAIQNRCIKVRHLPKEAARTQTGDSKRKKKYVTAKDKNPSQPSASTPMVDEMHKEVMQAASVQTSLGGTGEEGANPKLTRTNPSVLVDKPQSGRDGLYTNQPKPETEKGSTDDLFRMDSDKDNQSSVGDDDDDEIKLEDLTELIIDKGAEAMDLDSPEDDPPLLILVSEVEASLLKAQLAFLNVQQLTELLVNSLKPKLAKLLTDHDFSSFIRTELKELPSKVNKINGAVGELKQYMENFEIKVPCNLKLLPRKLEDFQSSISVLTSKVLDALPSLLNRVAKALDRFATTIDSASQKAVDNSVPLADQVSTHPAEGDKYTSKATITQLFQRKQQKDAANANQNKQPTIYVTTTIPETTSIPPSTTTTRIILTNLLFQSPFITSPIKTTPQTEGENVQDKGTKAMSHEEVAELESNSNSDAKIILTEEIENQKGIGQAVKADVAKSEINKGKKDLIDLFGLYVVEKMYRDKVKYDKYCL